MKISVAAFLSFLVLGISSSQAEPFGDDTIFKNLTGEWEGRGEFTGGDGSVTRIRETWTGKKEGGSVFAAGGTREMIDSESHTFQWRYLFNPTTELIECEMTMSTMEETVRFEVSVNESEGTISMRAPLGGDGAEISVVNRITENKIMGDVVIKDAGGNQTGGAKIEHRRPADWETVKKKAE